MNIVGAWENWCDADNFSGVFSVHSEQGVIFEKCRGFRNRNDNLLNNIDTAFGIASGTKMFTGLAICKLIDDKKLSLLDKLCDILPYDLGQIDNRISIFHLLTHTSGVGDYVDEESENGMEQLQALYNQHPVYLWERLEYYVPMITRLPPKFEPGERFGYSNSGFILLGLVIEAVSGISYQQYVTDTIIKSCKLVHTGFYRMDSLPANTAYGYMQDEKTGEWRTNIFSMPVVGGSDGGLFTCSADLDRLWRAIFSNKILSEDMLQSFLTSQVKKDDGDIHLDGDESYGLGIYLYRYNNNMVYYAVGGDFGVAFFTAYFPKQKIAVSSLGNTEINPYPLLEGVMSEVFHITPDDE